MKQNEDLINEVRTCQKQIRRMTSKLVQAGILTPGGEDTRFLRVFDQYLYAVVNQLVEDLYFQGSLTGEHEEDPPIDGSSGGLVEWVINQLRP